MCRSLADTEQGEGYFRKNYIISLLDSENMPSVRRGSISYAKWP